MATAGPNAPGTMADDNAVGTTTWANPTNVAASDDAYAVADPASGLPVQSHYLKCTNFGFAVTSGATINGVTVSIERKGKAGDTYPGSVFTRDYVVSLVKGGTVSGNNKAVTGSTWPSSDTSLDYGGAADLWGLALSDTDVNASTFGVVLQVEQRDRFGAALNTGSVDLVTITITYTESAGGLSIPVAMHSYRQRRV